MICVASFFTFVVVMYAACHPLCAAIPGQWLRLTAVMRLLEVELLLCRYASLSALTSQKAHLERLLCV